MQAPKAPLRPIGPSFLWSHRARGLYHIFLKSAAEANWPLLSLVTKTSLIQGYFRPKRVENNQNPRARGLYPVILKNLTQKEHSMCCRGYVNQAETFHGHQHPRKLTTHLAQKGGRGGLSNAMATFSNHNLFDLQ